MPIVEDIVQDASGKSVVVRIEVPEKSAISPGADYNNERMTRDHDQILPRAQDAFKGAMQLIYTCLTQVSTTIDKVPAELRPKECEVQFSIKIDGKVGAFLAESSLGAQLQVTLKWGEKEQK